MRWSWRIANVAGIPIRIHATFLLFLVWLFWASYARGGGAAQAAQGVGFILSAFACVLLHELGHALTGRRYGVVTRDITLLPIGGVARLDRIPQKPAQELAIALAGPFVNVVIAGILFLFMQASPDTFGDPTLLRRSFVARLFSFNIIVTVFNLLRALRPEDPLSRAVELLLGGHQQDFPVLGTADRGPPLGILARSDLLKALAGGRTDTKVADVARRNCGLAQPGEMLEDVFRRMQESGCPAVPVVEPGRGIVGMVTLENVGEFAMVQAALAGGQRIGPA